MERKDGSIFITGGRRLKTRTVQVVRDVKIKAFIQMMEFSLWQNGN